MAAPPAPILRGIVVAASTVCDFCLARVNYTHKIWFKTCINCDTGQTRLDACSFCVADDATNKCAYCAVDAGESAATVVRRRTPHISRILPFGKKSITVEQIGADVVVSGHTYPLRLTLLGHHATWDSVTRRWTAPNADIDDVERALVDAIDRISAEKHAARSNAALKAAATRQSRSKRATVAKEPKRPLDDDS
jgi:hypothetical protein